MSKKPLCAITCHFNPCGYERPRENLVHFADAFQSSRVPLYAIELVFNDDARFTMSGLSIKTGNRLFKHHVLCSTSRERGLMFQKEALLNVLIKRLTEEYDAIAWIDGDLIFTNPRWPELTVKALDHIPVVQLFSQAHLQDKTGEICVSTRSVGWYFSTRDPKWTDFNSCHPGLAWAARSEVLEKTSGLYPYAITGCGDTLMLQGWSRYRSPRVDSLFGGLHINRTIEPWVYAAWDIIDGIDPIDNMGFVMGDVVHLWHGEMRQRQNAERMEWLRELNPETDLAIRPDGVLEWTDFALKNKKRFVDGIASYFTSRDEDGMCTLES